MLISLHFCPFNSWVLFISICVMILKCRFVRPERRLTPPWTCGWMLRWMGSRCDIH